MRKPVVAIIDSGISIKFGYRDDVIGGVVYCTDESSVFMTDEFEDNNGHGTQCSYVIKKYCPEALIYIVKILDDEGRGSSLLLLLALKHLYDVDADIINVSLSISDTQYMEEISETIRVLHAQGKTVVVSVPNGKETGMPASFKGCFGVKSSDNCEGLIYDPSAPVQITVRAFPEFAESADGTFGWFGGNSCSAAIISGTLAGVLKKYPSDIDKTALIEKYFEENQSRLFIQKASEIEFNEEIRKLFIKCYDIFGNNADSNDIKPETALISGNRIMVRDTYAMIKECEKKLGRNIPYKKLGYYDFFDIKHFLSFICSGKSGSATEVESIPNSV